MPDRPTAALAIQVTRGILSMGWASWSVDHVSNPTLEVHPLARSRCQGLVLGIVNPNATSSGQFGTIPSSSTLQCSISSSIKDLTHHPDGVALGAAAPSGHPGERCGAVGASATPTAWN